MTVTLTQLSKIEANKVLECILPYSSRGECPHTPAEVGLPHTPAGGITTWVPRDALPFSLRSRRAKIEGASQTPAL